MEHLGCHNSDWDFSPTLGIQEGSNQDPREIGTAGIVVESVVPGR